MRATPADENRFPQQFARAVDLVTKYEDQVMKAADRPAVREVWGRMEREAIEQKISPNALATAVIMYPNQKVKEKLADALQNR